MSTWFRYFLGTPQRFVRTLIAAGIVLVMIKPELLERAVAGIFVAIQPLIGPAVTLAIVIYAIRIIIGGKRK